MRALLVTEELRASSDERWFPDADALRRCGDDVVVAARRGTGGGDGSAGGSYLPLGGRRNPARWWAELRRSPGAAAHLAWLCRSTPQTRDAPVHAFLRALPFAGADADVVHCASVGLAVAFPLLARLVGAPVVLTCTDTDLDRLEHQGRSARARGIGALASAAAIHCASDEGARRVAALVGRSVPTFVDGPAVPSTWVRTSEAGGPRPGPTTVVTIAPLIAESRIEPLLVAIAGARNAGSAVRLRIVGSGPLHSALRWAIDDLGLRDAAELLDDRDDVRHSALDGAEIFVETSQRGDAPVATLAALARGLAVVVPTGSAADGLLLRDGVEGVVVDTADTAALAGVLAELVESADLRGQLANAAIARVASSHTVDAQAARFHEWYRTVVAGADPSTPASGRRPGGALRVARYARTFPKKPGLVRQTAALLDLGVDVHVFAGSPSGYVDRFPDLVGRTDLAERVHYFGHARRSPWDVPGGLAELGRAVRFPRELARFAVHNWRTRHENGFGFWRGTLARLAVVGRPVDVFHVESDTWAPDVEDLVSFLGCPVLLDSRATLQRTTFGADDPDAHRRLFAMADGYCFVSRYVQENTVALGLAGVPMWVEPPGVDPELFAPPADGRPDTGAPLHVLMVGRLSWEKGYEWGLDALARTRAKGVDLRAAIVGGGFEGRAVQASIRRLGLDDVVRCTGDLDVGALLVEYHRADVLLHAAVDEAFGVALLEAQSTGLPVVTTDAGGLPEAVVHGETGFVVARRDAAALADRLEMLARDPVLRAAMGHAARARVVEHFDVRRNAQRVARIYEELVSPDGEASSN